MITVEPDIWRFLLIIGQWVVVPAIGWITVSVRGIYSELRVQNNRLTIQNNRLTKIEEKLQGHVTLDESRFDDLRELVKEVIASLREVRAP